MRFALIVPGKVRDGFARDGIAHYARLLKGRADLALIEVKDEKADPARREQALLAEAERLLRAAEPFDARIALDERGRAIDSVALSGWIAARKGAGASRIALLCGSAFGLHESVRRAADLALSLSPLTLPHQLALLVAAEQLFRAAKIERGEAYHY